MKTKFTFLAVALFSSFATFASVPSFTIVATNATVYNVHYKSAETSKVKVSIFNSANQLVYTEVLANVTSFVRPYNFSQLNEGEYTIVVEDKNGKQAEKVNYTMNKVTSIIKVSEIANESDKFLMNVSTTGAEVLTVRIFDSAQTLIYRQQVEVSGNFGQVYNLSKVKSADGVTFEVSTSNGKVETITF